MPITKVNFESIELEDVTELVDLSVPESIHLEYKVELYGNSDSQKKELLKDIAALANCQGGHLIIGVDETDGVASKIVGIDSYTHEKDQSITRIEQILRSGIEPSISDIRIKAISLSESHFVVVIRVPNSWNSPHRVTAQGDNRYYMRNSTGVHQPDVQELRVLFNMQNDNLTAARNFRFDRIDEVLGHPLRHDKNLEGSGKVFVHCVPIGFNSGVIAPPMELAYHNASDFRPLTSQSGGYNRYNFEGVIHQRGAEQKLGYTQVFRNGCLEAAWGGIIRIGPDEPDKRFIPGGALQDHLMEAIPRFLNGLRKLGVPSPILVMISLEEISGTKFIHRLQREYLPDEYSISYSHLHLPGCLIESYGSPTDIHAALQPALDTLWNALGEKCCPNFIDEGKYIPCLQ